jgi:glycosyltransferase involved in cell wall biosynthesis
VRVAFLLNSYPMTSTTFIRREIRALEALGVEVVRYAVRPWDVALVDPEDVAEQARTRYVLAQGALALLAAGGRELFRNPVGVAWAFAAWFQLVRNAGGAFVRHSAYLLEAITVAQWAARDRIEHVHVHFSTNATAVALLVRRLGGPSYSFTAHGPDEFDDPVQGSLALKIREARFVVAISHFARTRLALAAGRALWERLVVVRCGIDADLFPLSQDPFAAAPFVCVGRLCPQKAQWLVVEAVGRLVSTGRDVRVRFVGDGDDRAAIEARIRALGLQEHVELLGWQDNDTVRRTLAGARALLLPSFAEGLPIVIMESLALGRPVISSYIAGIPELVDASCGWLVPAGSVDGIVEAMEQVLDAPDASLAEMGRVGRTRVRSHHSVRASAEQLAALFRDGPGASD